MERRWINELKDGDLVEEVYFVADRQLRANRNAALYLSMDLRDRTGAMNARMWNVTEDTVTDITEGGYVHIRGKVQLFQGSLQLILSHVNSCQSTGLDPQDFEQTTSQNVNELRIRLEAAIASVRNEGIRELLQEFMLDEIVIQRLLDFPAGVKAHHAYRGGLIEHLVTLLDLASHFAQVYSRIDRDLLIAGVILHDLGKTRELCLEQGFSYTDEGQLLGHLVIGVEMITEKLAQLEQRTGITLPDETIWRLKHMVVSHHGSYEYGSPRLPMTPESIVLHLLDHLDAKLHEFHNAIDTDPNGQSHWTMFLPRLERKLFKGSVPRGGNNSTES